MCFYLYAQLTPKIPALWEAEAGGSPELGSQRPAWATWQNPISTKNTKKISQGGDACLWSQPLGRLRWEDSQSLEVEAEVAVSRDYVTALQPG